MTFQEFEQRYKYDSTTDRLGGGGFGEVFKAYDTHRDRWVALKIAKVLPDYESVRLRKEVEMVEQLPTHPNIAYYEECYTFKHFDGEYDFGILQYYEEGNLLQLETGRQLTDQQKDRILRQILAGLAFLHDHGVIHRDLKPQNILIVKRGDEYIPKITDFGISKKLDTDRSALFSNSLVGAGTLAYSSPEQLKETEIRKNTDLWSLAVITFRMFTGELPFTTGGHAQTSELGRQELFRRINSGLLPESIQRVPEPWKTLIARCLIPDPTQRLSNCKEAFGILDGTPSANASAEETLISNNNTRPPQPEPEEDTDPPPATENSKTKLWMGIAAACVIGVGIFFLFGLNGQSPASPPVQKAQTNTTVVEPATQAQVQTTTTLPDDSKKKREQEERERITREEKQKREQEEKDRIAREEKQKREQEEKDRIALEEKRKKEQEERDRIACEQEQKREQEEKDRIAREEKQKREQEEKDRIALEEKRKKEQEERDRIAREQELNKHSVVVNGIRWAKCNVASPGTFAARPESPGMLYQWNRRKAWNATGEKVRGWDSSEAPGDRWAKANDPCPAGWRVPTHNEFVRLDEAGSIRTTLNGVPGRQFGSGSNTVFLSAAGCRNDSDGALNYVGDYGHYWSATYFSATSAYYLYFHYYGNITPRASTSRATGFPVRCVQE